MVSFNKFECFVEDLANKLHGLFGNPSTDTIKVYLSNATPSASGDLVKADLAEISAGNGYSAGGASVTPVGSRSGGTFTLSGTKVVFTASGGAIAQFRYVVLYNDSTASDSLIGWWDYGSALDIQSGETFSVKFNNSDTTGNILTIA